ncbi:hypothetical protein [Agarivorans sp. QJM3NY_25]|uniref:hypothetical protein n=1 Tax=Agarivorans sp. QJM3NY_25 TaxID=3421430 RepID=UPI003D7D9F8A
MTFLQRTFTSLVHAHAGRTQGKSASTRRFAPRVDKGHNAASRWPLPLFAALYEKVTMKKLIVFALSLFAGFGVHASELTNEASMNFDLENVVQFLTDLDDQFKFGLDVKALGNFSSAVPVEAEKSIVVNIVDSGRKSKMEFRVFMDDIDAPDLYMFFDSSNLSESVSKFMMGWAEERGM